MKILAIESSCDETAAAVIEDGRKICSNIINSQAEEHALYGGVVPEIASRGHIEAISGVARAAVREAGMEFAEVDAIAATCAPGLIGALLVGANYAKSLAWSLHKPFIPVHHIRGHIAANLLAFPELEPPFLCLSASGGSSMLVLVRDYTDMEILGGTRDDAAGEAFDKVARAIGLGYPGGPKIDKVSKEGNPDAIHFPRAKVVGSEYDFSFSGLKSAVLNYLNGCEMKHIPVNQADVAASFQKAVVDVLVEHSIHGVKESGLSKFAIAGGVASNSSLRNALREACEKEGISFYYPSPVYCTDNAAMIGVAGYYEYQKGVRHGYDLNAVPNLKLGERV